MLKEFAAGRLAVLHVVLPKLVAGLRFDRDHARARSREIEHPVNFDWSGFERGNLVVVRIAHVGGYFTRVKGPGSFKLGNILAVDLVERRVPHTARVMPIRSPLVVRNRLANAKAGNEEKQREPEKDLAH